MNYNTAEWYLYYSEHKTLEIYFSFSMNVFSIGILSNARLTNTI